MTIDEYLKKHNINPFDDVLDIIDLMKKNAQATNDKTKKDFSSRKCVTDNCENVVGPYCENCNRLWQT